jgi:hypothetical protein
MGAIFLLCGCAVVAVPPAVTIASYAVDGVSYIATGKSLTDHAISEIAGEDCVLMRAAVLKNPCREHVEPDSELAVELETSYGGEDVSTEIAEADLAAGGAPSGRSRSAVVLAAARPGAAAARPARYVVIGSFRDRGNAERARRSHAAAGAAVVPASVRGRAFYRVVAPRAAAPAPARKAGARWTIGPCAGTRDRASACLDPAAEALLKRGPARRSPFEQAAASDGQVSERATPADPAPGG